MIFFSHIRSFLFPSLFHDKDLSKLPLSPDPHYTDTYTRFNYQDPTTKKLILHLKRYADPKLLNLLGKELYDELLEPLSYLQEAGFFTKPYILNLPSSGNYHQACFLAEALSQHLPEGKLLKNSLFLKEKRAKQARLKNKKLRYLNRAANIGVRNTNIKNQDIIIIDDLCSSGATMKEAQKMLYTQGARKVLALSLAHPFMIY